MVASAVAAEGKTLSATNLALIAEPIVQEARAARRRRHAEAVDPPTPPIENGIGLSDMLKRPGERLHARHCRRHSR